MMEWIVSSSVLILIVIAIRYMLKGKISLRVQYALWGLVLVRLLVPVSFGSSIFSVSNFLPESILQEKWEESHEVEVINGTQQSVVIPANTGENGTKRPESSVTFYGGNNADSVVNPKTDEVQEVQTAINRWELANVVWMTGSIFVGTVLLLANVMFAMRLKNSRKKVKQSIGKLNVYCTEAVETPCLFGIFCPSIYLTPSSMESEMSMWHVLEHETTHYRHGDHIWAILRGVCLAIHWYNPLVWWAAFLSGTDAELACDEATIKRIGEQERAEYGKTLLGMTCRTRTKFFVASTTMAGGKRNLKERIAFLVKKPQMAAYTLVTVIVMAVAAVGCTFTGNKEELPVNDMITSFPTATPSPTPSVVPAEVADVTPTIAAQISPEPTVTPVEVWQEQEEIEKIIFDIQKELETVEITYKDMQKELQTDTTLNQGEMNTLAGECAILWEEALDDFWYTLEPLLTWEEVRDLHKEQQEWLTMRDMEVQALIDEYDGGSITGLVVGTKKAELTRERTYALAEQLKQVVNRMTGANWQNYSGYYTNNEDTDSVYDELKLELLEDGTYRAEIGIYRLTTLEGTAVAYGDMLWFEDTVVGVKGNIRFFDNEVVFTVTESDFSHLTPGEGFEFIKSE